jgi:hypothetical protein
MSRQCESLERYAVNPGSPAESKELESNSRANKKQASLSLIHLHAIGQYDGVEVRGRVRHLSIDHVSPWHLKQFTTIFKGYFETPLTNEFDRLARKSCFVLKTQFPPLRRIVFAQPGKSVEACKRGPILD